MITKEFTELLDNNGILYSIVADLEIGTIEHYGEKDNLKHEGLLKTLFFDLNSIVSLNNSLKDRMMPHLWRQGEVACIVSKPKNNIIGLLYNDDGDNIKQYHFSKQIDKDIKTIWTT